MFNNNCSLKGAGAGSGVSVPVTAACLVLSVAVCMAAQTSDTAFVIVSGKDNYWKAGTVTQGSGNATVTVNASQKNQKWLGFAGTFNEAGWDALNALSASDKERAIRLLFDKKDGIGFTYGRIPIGASDYALERYCLNSTKDDFTMGSFSINRDKNNLIPYIKAAQAVKPDLKFWASAWTPPPWMKTGAADAAGYDGGEMRNDPKYLAANALYTARFCEAYKAEGIPISFVFPQNEPGYTQYYPTCGWGKYRLPDGSSDVNKTEYLSTYVADYLEDTLKKRSPETSIWCGTLSNDKFANDYWNGAKSKAGQIVKGLGLQWNCLTLVKSAAGAGYLTMCSEHQCGNYPWLGDQGKIASSPEDANRNNFLRDMAPNNHAYGEESWDLIKAWIVEGVNIYSAWNMVLDTKGLNLDKSREWPQNALLAVDKQAKTLKVTAYYYVMRHIGQYVDTGAVRLGTSGGDALAFQNPNGGIVTTVSNTGGQSTMTISVGGKNYQFSHPGKGWATLYVGPKPVKSTNDITHNHFFGDGNGIRITCKEDGYRIALSSRESGRIELLSLTGRVLESRALPQGSREMLLRKQASHAGLLLVRVVCGGKTETARLFNAR
ncbi:MAG: glycoside hydrolase family 30 protein [Chitinispirillaceae bacterium]|nr:glycoside hydrolase family 30 protein [Chitinispirillaceae bacterium]